MAGLNAASLANQPVSLIAKHRVDEHAGDKNPIRLTGISAEHQSLTSSIAGYPITWTYYMKDNNLYVESFSSDPTFGGVNQTYYLDGEDRNYGMPAMIGLLGDDSNKHMDVYKISTRPSSRFIFGTIPPISGTMSCAFRLRPENNIYGINDKETLWMDINSTGTALLPRSAVPSVFRSPPFEGFFLFRLNMSQFCTANCHMGEHPKSCVKGN